MEFFNSAIDVLQTLVTAIGAGLAVWGAINLLEGYGNDNPGAKSQGIKQLMAGGGIALVGMVLVQSIAIDADIMKAVWTCMGYTVLLCFTLFKTGSLSKSVFSAHCDLVPKKTANGASYAIDFLVETDDWLQGVNANKDKLLSDIRYVTLKLSWRTGEETIDLVCDELVKSES